MVYSDDLSIVGRRFKRTIIDWAVKGAALRGYPPASDKAD